VTNVEAKKIIAQKALKLITPGLTLYLDSGSTATLLASQMEDQSNLIVTSSLSCAMELARASQLKTPSSTRSMTLLVASQHILELLFS
jgi:DeoR family transcriptional regulator of aga operon